MKRILTGDRPTGKLHLGHYVGTLENRVKLQYQYETFVMQADVQALTDHFHQPQKVHDAVYQTTLDNLAIGLDPQRVAIFIQSQIPELAELTVYFMNLVTLSRLKRNPTIKAEMSQKGFGAGVPVGFLNYPVSEAADILGFRADLVPAGDDQTPMIEQTREIVRQFNRLYEPIFAAPEILVGRVARLVGTDGRSKMSKSLGNVIYLSDQLEQIEKKVMRMYTDPARIHADDPGQTTGNPVFTYLKIFATDQNRVSQLQQKYHHGLIGDVEVKHYLITVLEQLLAPIRQRRLQYEEQPDLVKQILQTGTEKARAAATQTMISVRKAMKLDYS